MMKLFFVINPKSGKGLPVARLKAGVEKYFPQADLAFTEYAGHATPLAARAVAEGYDAVIAVGGDGTLNEVARALANTQTALGVVPRGSGNGFAREIGMPLGYENALLALRQTKSIFCDLGQANGDIFLNLAGVGIEAQIAWDFMKHGQSGARGKWPYFKLGVQAALRYRPQTLTVTSDGKTETLTPLTLVFANGTQYGSNFKIAPQASLTDGQLQRVEVLSAPKWKLALAAPQFFSSHYRPLCVTRTVAVKETLIEHKGPLLYHLDGEPKTTQDELHISIRPKALKLLICEE